MYILKLKNETGIFQNENSFMKTHLNFVCVYINLSNTQLIYSLHFILKTNLNTYKLNTSLLENLLLKIFFFFLTWSETLIQRARLLLNTGCDLDARALESTRASFKT